MSFSKINNTKNINNGGYVVGHEPTVIRKPENELATPSSSPSLEVIANRFNTGPSGWFGEGFPKAWI